MIDPHCHTSSIKVARPADQVFGLMADGIQQGQWAWGSFDREDLGQGVYAGTSMFDGGRTFVRLNVDADRLLVDYDVGRAPDALAFRNSARVLPGVLLGHEEGSCVVTLMTWRHVNQDEAAWLQTSTIHEAEMFLIRGLAERAAG
ncbi:hypothetical protein [Pseudooceanicola sp. HF7]|uniref:hypothetical protein n=1 Tax=Pseudooceanicola sp. HF7 TaxID=2721560 RepID=UPI001431F6FC|nr:hypothetical protein [Pseudooceanicola sp. HF7]NIZ09392.1 hypothetical protein [Pseudooceanicola sp. HF7]